MNEFFLIAGLLGEVVTTIIGKIGVYLWDWVVQDCTENCKSYILTILIILYFCWLYRARYSLLRCVSCMTCRDNTELEEFLQGEKQKTCTSSLLFMLQLLPKLAEQKRGKIDYFRDKLSSLAQEMSTLVKVSGTKEEEEI